MPGNVQQAEHTAQMASLLKLKLREYGLSLREAARDGAEKAELESRKTEMLGVIYRMLVLNLGEPPVRFTWTRRDAEGRPVLEQRLLSVFSAVFPDLVFKLNVSESVAEQRKAIRPRK